MTLLPAFPGTAHPNLAVAADKSGRIYLLNTSTTWAGSTPADRTSSSRSSRPTPKASIYSSPVYFNGMVYIQGVLAT